MKKMLLITTLFMFCCASSSLAALVPPVLSFSTDGVVATIDWTAVPEATGYKLYYAAVKETGTGKVSSKDMGASTTVDFTLPEGSSFNIAVKAYNDLESSPLSNVELLTIGVFSTPPAAPGLSATTSGFDLTIDWNTVADATGYLLNYAPTSSYTGPESFKTKEMAAENSFAAVLKKGGAYTVAVQAYNDQGTSDYSNIESVDVVTYGIASEGRWGGSFIQARNYENSGLASDSKGYIAYSNQTGEPLDSVISKVELFESASLLGTQTAPQTQNIFNYDCRGVSCVNEGSSLDEEYYFFTVNGALTAGTYDFVTTLSDAASTAFSTEVVYPGDLQLPVIVSTSQTAAWNGTNLVLSWASATGENAGMVDQLRAVIYGGDNKLYVMLPADATTVSIPATVLAPLGLTPTYNFYNARWQMQTRAHGADGKNYARGISNKVALPGAPPTAFSKQNLKGKTLYTVWYEQSGAVVAKHVFKSNGTVDVTGLLNHDDYFGVPFGVTAAGLLYYYGVSTQGNTITCSGANFIKTEYTENGVFDSVDLYFFEKSKALGFANTLSSDIPRGCN